MSNWEVKTEIGRGLENILYPILSSTENKITVTFVDFKYDTSSPKSSGKYQEISGPDVFNKEVELKTIPVKIKDNNILESIKEHLNLEFAQIIKKEGLKSRENVYSLNKKDIFDIDINQWKEDLIITPPIDNSIDKAVMRRIIAKLNNCSNFIATNGRVGPARYIITNEKTNNVLYNILKENMFNMGIMTFVVDKELEDKDIIMGRKNDADQPGVILVINEKSFEDIDGDVINLTYSFSVDGFKPETQYYLINKK